ELAAALVGCCHELRLLRQFGFQTRLGEMFSGQRRRRLPFRVGLHGGLRAFCSFLRCAFLRYGLFRRGLAYVFFVLLTLHAPLLCSHLAWLFVRRTCSLRFACGHVALLSVLDQSRMTRRSRCRSRLQRIGEFEQEKMSAAVSAKLPQGCQCFCRATSIARKSSKTSGQLMK